MTTEEAKFILMSYRPNGADAADPLFAEALEQTERSPELASWFSEEQARSQKLSEKLRDIEVPAELRDQLLTGGKASQVEPEAKAPRRWPRVLQMVALLLMLAGTMFWWQNRFVESGDASLQAYRVDMGAYLNRMFTLDFESTELAKVQRWIGSQSAPLESAPVPSALADTETLGCEVIQWHGHDIYLICFNVDGELVHLFNVPDAVDATAIATAMGQRVWTQTDEWAGTTWQADGQTFYAMTRGDQAFLKSSLGV